MHIKNQSAIIAGLARVEKLEVVQKGKKPDQCATAVVNGAQLYVPLGSLVDVVAEKERLTIELQQAQTYLTSLENKLKNESFVARAPAQVVAAEREKQRNQEEQVSRLKEQFKALG